MDNNDLVPFEGKKIRKEWQNDEWYFVLADVILLLSDSKDPKQYLDKLRKRDSELDSYLRTNCTYVGMKGETGKKRQYLCANTEGVLRLTMSVPSPKAEPFKLWLAEQGKRVIDEVENPELLTERQAELYRAKGYSEEWITRRVQTIDVRKQLTDEWKTRGVTEGSEYSILTAEIAKATFGLAPNEHRKLKNLEKPSQNLRDHMTPLELIFTALGEEMTRDITVRNDAQGFSENHEAAVKGGSIAGNARRNVEKERGLPIVSSDNFLGLNKELPTNTLEKEEE